MKQFITDSLPYVYVSVAFIIIILVLYIIGVYVYSKIREIRPTIREATVRIRDNLYLFLLPFPILYLLFYYFIYEEGNNENIKVSKEINDYLKTISYYFFSAGIFSATFKLINSLVVFKKHFKEIVLSNEFDEVMNKKFDALTFSTDYLISRSDLDDIWAKVTICKYEQRFPDLITLIKPKLANLMFKENNLSYYYRNFRTQIRFELVENDMVKITEISDFIIISSSVNEIVMDFWISSPEENGEETRFVPELCKNGNQPLKIEEVNDSSQMPNTQFFQAKLQGQKQYIIERGVEITQKLSIDREFLFSSKRLIDNLIVNLVTCDKLNLFFSATKPNSFRNDNQTSAGQSYICSDLIITEDIFKVFIYKKNE